MDEMEPKILHIGYKEQDKIGETRQFPKFLPGKLFSTFFFFFLNFILFLNLYKLY